MSSYSVVSTMRAPMAGCARTQAHSSAVSGPRFAATESGRATLPTSCRMPASRTRSTASGARPSSRAVSSAKRPTLWEWVALPESRTSSASARFEQRGQLHVRVAVPAARSLRADAGHLRAGDDRAIAAEPLGRVERLVGGAQQAVGGLPVKRVRGDPEADRERRLAVGERLLDRCADALGQHVGAVLVAVRSEDRELLSPYARRQVEAALRPADRARHAPQDGVAGSVPVGVVHALEAVEVSDNEAERLVGAARALE